MADVGATDEDDMEVNNMPGGRSGGSGRGGGGFGRGRGQGRGGSGGGFGDALEPFIGIGESIIKGVSGMRKAPEEDIMRIQPVGEPIRVKESDSRQPVGVNPGFPDVEKDLSVRAEVNILKDQVSRIGDLLEKINNRLDSMEKNLKTGEKEEDTEKEEEVQ